MKQITQQPSETMSQAISWETTKNRYVRLGLCDKCSAQAAWGHQEHAGGWDDLSPPCEGCASIVSGFPRPTTNPVWRKCLRSDSIASSPTSDGTKYPREQRAEPTDDYRPSAGPSCKGCGSRWTGLNAAHCAGCCRTFTSATGFDKHRRDGRCLDPATARARNGYLIFVPADRPWPGWSLPGTWSGPDQ